MAGDSIAIVGIGCRFPGARGAEAFWSLLERGLDAIREVPGERWDIDKVYDADPAKPGRMNTRSGGFIEDVACFDNTFFGISRREAVAMDPQHRILLEVCWEALEDAGIPADTLAGCPVGVFVGISSFDYLGVTRDSHERIEAHSTIGMAHSIAANRISYLLNLHGPSLAVDTACSSSLVAVHLACESLLSGDCTAALACGVNLILTPDLTVAFSKARMMAPDGRCKTFDDRADGYVRGEGAGVVVLKPVHRAIADGDRIYAVIRGSAINHDGLTNGLTAPNPASQRKTVELACQRAGIDPSDLHSWPTEPEHGPAGAWSASEARAGASERTTWDVRTAEAEGADTRVQRLFGCGPGLKLRLYVKRELVKADLQRWASRNSGSAVWRGSGEGERRLDCGRLFRRQPPDGRCSSLPNRSRRTF